MRHLIVSEVARQIGARPKDISDLFYQRKLDQTAVMMLTSKADRSTIAEAMKAGADGYVIKPFTGENLARRARQILKHVRIAA